MKILLDMAISPNGYIAREDGDEDWLSESGWFEFLELATKMNNIVMGRETYQQVTNRYQDYNFDNVNCKYKIIITKDRDFTAPKKYVVVHSPEEAVEFLDKQGIKELFLIGGGKLNSEFIKRKLVDTIQLTINPCLIGNGRNFLAPSNFEDIQLKLIKSTILENDRVLLVYKLMYQI